MDLYILKIGGSVCTEKSKNLCEAKTELIREIAKEIKQAMRQKKFRLVLVHGAGPFGHKLVHDYKISNGVKTPKQIEGFVKTHSSMNELNKIFLENFIAEGLNVFPIQPSASIIQSNKKIKKFDTEIIEKILDLNIIPVLYGDMVLDEKLNASVVSGDAIIPFLARKLKAKKIFFGTDVAGIFTEDPKKVSRAKLIEKIHPHNFEEILVKVSGSNAVDVTGGMRGKLLELKQNLNGLDVFVFDSTKRGNVLNSLLGKKIIGTEIKF